jgi:hypothetical protein
MHTLTHLHGYRALSAGLLLVFAQALSAQVGLGLSPMRLEMKMTPGKEQSGVLTLSSDSTDRVRVRAEALDFWIDQDQTPQFETRLPSEAGFSCRDWVSVNPVETEVAPFITAPSDLQPFPPIVKSEERESKPPSEWSRHSTWLPEIPALKVNSKN